MPPKGQSDTHPPSGARFTRARHTIAGPRPLCTTGVRGGADRQERTTRTPAFRYRGRTMDDHGPVTVILVHGVPETDAVWRPLRDALGRDDVMSLSPPGFGAPVPGGFG